MNTRFLFTCVSLSLLALLLTGCSVAPTKIAENKSPISAPVGMATKSVLLAKIVTNIPLGEKTLNIYHSWWCSHADSVEWRGGRLNLTDDELVDSFRREFVQSNYSVAGDPKALFDDATARNADLWIAGSIEKLETNVCYPFAGGFMHKIKGSSFMQVRWQIFSKADGKVVYEVNTEGSCRSDGIITGSASSLLKQAFSANVRNLLADPSFHSILKASSPKKAIPAL